MECTLCHDDLEHCHDVSVEHADGTTHCFDDTCTVPHEAHDWQLPCSAFDPPCNCIPEESLPPVLLVAA